MKKRPGFLSVGAAAIIAGCGGGGGSVNGALPAHVPPTNPDSGPMTTASLRIAIPARGSKTVRRRSPKWVSPSGTTLGVRVLAAPIPNPTPTEQAFNLPSPGPEPTSVTVQVTAPISTDTFVASVYDNAHNLLATGSSIPVAISLTGTPSVSVAMLGVAGGIQYTVAGGTPAVWRVLENLSAPQTTLVDAQPIDADGNSIPGTLASPASLSTTGGVTLSTQSISGDTSVTATYPGSTAGSGSITSPLALNAGASALNAAVDADYYVFADNADGSLYVIDGLTQKQAGAVVNGASGGQIAALSGCASGAFAVSGSAAGASVFSVAAPTTISPTPGPVATSVSAAILSANPFNNGVAGDSQCNVFYYNTNAGDPVTKLNGFDSTITATSSFATGFQSSYAMKTIGGQLYAPASLGPTSYQAFSVPETTGGTATVSTVFTTGTPILGVVVGGSGASVFLVASTCSGQPVLQQLSGGSAITLSQFTLVAGATESKDGLIYLAGPSVAAGSAATLAYGPPASIGTAPTITLGGTAVDVAVTPDQQYVCVLEDGAASGGQIEFYRRTPTPSLVATVPLSASVSPQSFSIGP